MSPTIFQPVAEAGAHWLTLDGRLLFAAKWCWAPGSQMVHGTKKAEEAVAASPSAVHFHFLFARNPHALRAFTAFQILGM